MSVNPTQINSKQIQKAMKKGAKKALSTSGAISSTRSGDKELSHLITRLSQQSFNSLGAAELFGESLGQKIIELSQKLNRTYLDQGVIRQLIISKDIPSVAQVPKQETQVVTVTDQAQDFNQASGQQLAEKPQPSTQQEDQSSTDEEESMSVVEADQQPASTAASQSLDKENTNESIVDEDSEQDVPVEEAQNDTFQPHETESVAVGEEDTDESSTDEDSEQDVPVEETQNQGDITLTDTSEPHEIESIEEVHQEDEVEAAESLSEVASEH